MTLCLPTYVSNLLHLLQLPYGAIGPFTDDGKSKILSVALNHSCLHPFQSSTSSLTSLFSFSHYFPPLLFISSNLLSPPPSPPLPISSLVLFLFILLNLLHLQLPFFLFLNLFLPSYWFRLIYFRRLLLLLFLSYASSYSFLSFYNLLYLQFPFFSFSAYFLPLLFIPFLPLSPSPPPLFFLPSFLRFVLPSSSHLLYLTFSFYIFFAFFNFFSSPSPNSVMLPFVFSYWLSLQVVPSSFCLLHLSFIFPSPSFVHLSVSIFRSLCYIHYFYYFFPIHISSFLLFLLVFITEFFSFRLLLLLFFLCLIYFSYNYFFLFVPLFLLPLLFALGLFYLFPLLLVLTSPTFLLFPPFFSCFSLCLLFPHMLFTDVSSSLSTLFRFHYLPFFFIICIPTPHSHLLLPFALPLLFLYLSFST